MSTFRKLTAAHVSSIYRLHALGHKPVAIAELLTEGMVTDDGTELYPVRVGEAAVRHHLNADGGEQAVQEWRLRLYRDVYLSAAGPMRAEREHAAPGVPVGHRRTRPSGRR